ncbi:MAG: hypothetical protein R2772_05895 [Chitinophagales bacterium]
MFVLGLLLWMYGRNLQSVEDFIETKFRKNPLLKEANLKVLRTGFYYGETAELQSYKKEIKAAKLEPSAHTETLWVIKQLHCI